MSELPPFVVRSATVPEVEGHYPAPFDVERLSFGKDLGRAAGGRSLGCWEERIPRGRRTSFTHAHLREEEAVYVLAGRPVLRWIDGAEAREVELAPGDYVAFPAATGLAHTFRNDRDEDAIVLCVGERKPGDASCYPDDPAYEAWRDEHRPHGAWPGPERPNLLAAWPAWSVETERLVLRPWQPQETNALLALIRQNQAHLSPFMPWARTPPTPDELLITINGFLASFLGHGSDLVYGMFLPDGRPIGNCGLHARIGAEGLEIGYWIGEAHQGKGYVTEAAAALCRLVFEARRKQLVEIHCDTKNTRSAAIPVRLGFVHVGTLPGRYVDAAGQPLDTMVWSMTAAQARTSALAERPVVARDALGRRLL